MLYWAIVPKLQSLGPLCLLIWENHLPFETSVGGVSQGKQKYKPI